MTSSPSAWVPAPHDLFVGIDVAKDSLDLAVARPGTGSDEPVLRVANDDAGRRQLCDHLRTLTPRLIVIEATGGYEEPLLELLLDAGLPVARVHPGRVRHVAKGVGVLAKTDAIDARVLAQFAWRASPRITQRRSKVQTQLDALITCRRQLTQVRAQQATRRQQTRDKDALKSIDAVLVVLDAQIKTLDAKIASLIDSDDDFKHLDTLLRSVPGVGQTLSATLLGELGELGRIDKRQLGALVGVAPFNNDSGKTSGRRSIRGGRASVRNVLYMGTLAAMKHNPVIAAFANRLKTAGKRPKVVIVACMRKLLTLLNAMVRENLSWQQLRSVNP